LAISFSSSGRNTGELGQGFVRFTYTTYDTQIVAPMMHVITVGRTYDPPTAITKLRSRMGKKDIPPSPATRIPLKDPIRFGGAKIMAYCLLEYDPN
jgi:hypothetical protein